MNISIGEDIGSDMDSLLAGASQTYYPNQTKILNNTNNNNINNMNKNNEININLGNLNNMNRSRNLNNEIMEKIQEKLRSTNISGEQSKEGGSSQQSKKNKFSQIMSNSNNNNNNNNCSSCFSGSGFLEQKKERQTIQVIGKGGYGVVKKIISIETNNRCIYAEKSFKNDNGFYDEFFRYNTLQEHFSKIGKLEELKQYCMILQKWDENQKKLYYDLGLCSLQEFMDQRSKKGVKWEKEELLYYFYFLLNFAFMMYENDFFHSDIKNANLVLDVRKDEELLTCQDLKVIDFGILSKFEFNKAQDCCTPMYFNSFKRNQGRNYRFQSKEERLKAEVYTIFRSFQELCISQISEQDPRKKQYQELFSFEIENVHDTQEKGVFKKYKPYQTKERLEKLMEGIKDDILKEFYEEGGCFKLFLDFLSEKLIDEEYDVEEDLRKGFLRNEKIFPQRIHNYGIFDNQGLINNIVATKIQANREISGQLDNNKVMNQVLKDDFNDPIEVFYQLESYVEGAQCSKVTSSMEGPGEDLYEATRYFLSDEQTMQNVFLLLGEGGFGKSTFLLWLQDKISNLCLIQLSKFESLQDLESYVEDLLTIKYNNDENAHIKLLLDGYDELILNSEQQRVDISRLFNFNKFKNMKVIVTSRKCSIDIKNLEQYFVDLEVIQICIYYLRPFNEEQVQTFTKEYLQKINQKKYFYNLKTYRSISDYLSKLKSNQILKELAQVPLALRLLLQVLPNLENDIEIEHQKQLEHNLPLSEMKTKYQITQHFYSKFNFYKKFVESWVYRKVQQKFNRQMLICVLQESELRKMNLDNNIHSLQVEVSKVFQWVIKDLAFQLFVCKRICFDFYFVETKVIQQKLIQCGSGCLCPIKNKYQLKFQQLDIKTFICLFFAVSPIKMIFRGEQASLENGNFEFLHKNVFEYLVSNVFIKDIRSIYKMVLNRPDDLNMNWLADMKLNQQILDISHQNIIYQVIEYMKYRISDCEMQRKIIEVIIRFSKIDNTNRISILAANMFTIYSCFQFNFSGMDLSGIKISKAILEYGKFDHVNFQHADLSHTLLRDVCMENSDISYANMEKSNFGKILDLFHNQGTVNQVKVSPKYTYFLSCGQDTNIYLQKSKEIKNSVDTIFYGHSNNVKDAQFSNDENYIVSCSYDQSIKVWNIERRSLEINIINAHDSWINSCCFSRNGKFIISGDQQGIIKVWDWKNEDSSKILHFSSREHFDAITCVRFSPSNDFEFVTSSQDYTVKKWNLQEKRCDFTFEGHNGWVNSVEYNLKGDKIVTASNDCSIKQWDIVQKSEIKFQNVNRCLPMQTHHFDWIVQAKYSKKEDFIISCSYDKSIKVWDAKTMSFVVSFIGHNGPVTTIDLSKCQNYIISGGIDKKIKIWEFSGHQKVCQLSGHSHTITTCKISSDNQEVVSCDINSRIYVWKMQSGQPIFMREQPLKQYPMQVVLFSKDSRYLIGGSYDSNIYIFDKIENKLEAKLENHTKEIISLNLSEDGNILASAGSDKVVYLWDWKNGKSLVKIVNQEQVFKVQLLKDINQVVIGTYNNFFKLVKVDYEKQCVLEEKYGQFYQKNQDQYGNCGLGLKSHKMYFQESNRESYHNSSYLNKQSECICFKISNCEKFMVAGYQNLQMHLFDFKTFKETGQLNDFYVNYVNSENVKKLAFSHDAKQIIGIKENKVKIWSIEGKLLQILNHSYDNLVCMDISSDSKYIIFGGISKSLFFFKKNELDFQGSLSSSQKEKIENEDVELDLDENQRENVENEIDLEVEENHENEIQEHMESMEQKKAKELEFIQQLREGKENKQNKDKNKDISSISNNNNDKNTNSLLVGQIKYMMGDSNNKDNFVPYRYFNIIGYNKRKLFLKNLKYKNLKNCDADNMKLIKQYTQFNHYFQ